MKINISNATTSNLEEIFNLQKDYEHILISKDSLKEDLNNTSCVYYIATDDSNNVIGAIGGTILVDHMDISIVITRKDYVGKGIASLLLNELISYCRKNNIEKIFLEVRTSNIPAIKLYEKVGFEKISTRQNYYPDNNEDALIYMLEI